MAILEYLLVCDYDGTLFRTFEPSINGVDVHKAYEDGILSIFGQQGLEIYRTIGELQNRAPGELVRDILNAGERENLVTSARNFLISQENFLNSLVPDGKGAELNWDDNPVEVITEMLIRCKLSQLIKEIGLEFPNGDKWPRPCAGVFKLIEAINELKEHGIKIDLAILSSGHERFIKKTFDVWTIPCPEVLVTDDDMRGKTYPEDPKKRVKPAATLFEMVHLTWAIAKYGAGIEKLELLDFVRETRQRMAYFGDDPIKDGQLAKNANVPFGLFSSTKNKDLISFGNWSVVADLLKERATIQAFKAGLSFAQIISALR